MNLLHADAPTTLLIAGWVIVLAALLQSAWTVRHRFLPTPATQHGWLAAAEAWAGGTWEFYLRHPWVLQVAGNRAVLGPNELAGYEALLRWCSDAHAQCWV